MQYQDNCYICLEKTNIYFSTKSCNCKIYCHDKCFNKLFLWNNCIICKKKINKKNFFISTSIIVYFYYKIINYLINFTIINLYSKLELFVNFIFTIFISLFLFIFISLYISLYNYFFIKKYYPFIKYYI